MFHACRPTVQCGRVGLNSDLYRSRICAQHQSKQPITANFVSNNIVSYSILCQIISYLLKEICIDFYSPLLLANGIAIAKRGKKKALSFL